MYARGSLASNGRSISRRRPVRRSVDRRAASRAVIVARHVVADQDPQINALAQARLFTQGACGHTKAPRCFVRFGLVTRAVLNFALLEPRGAPVGNADAFDEQTRHAMFGEPASQTVHGGAVTKLDPGWSRGRAANATRSTGCAAAGFLRAGGFGFANNRLRRGGQRC